MNTQIALQILGKIAVLTILVMSIAGCSTDTVRIYNTIDIPNSILSPVSTENKPIVIDNKANVENILYDYKNTYYSLMVCNARITYINRYIKKYNESLIN